MLSKLFGNRLLTKIIMTNVMQGSIFIPEQFQKKTQEAVVVMVGEEVDNIIEGDRVIYDALMGKEIEIEGEKYLLLYLEDVLGIVRRG